MSETLLWNVRPAVSDLDALVAAYVEEVTALLRPDAVLFGHSMGAVVAYHVLRALRERPRAAGRLPRTLVLSASCAPQHVPAEGYADLSDSALLLIGVFNMGRRHLTYMAWALAASGVTVMLMGSFTSIWWIGAMAFLFFMTLPPLNTSVEVLVRSSIPNRTQGRVWGLIGLISQLGYIVAYAISGVLADAVFTPLLRPGGALADSVGRIIGVGESRGIGLMFIGVGALMVLIAPVLPRVASVRALEATAAQALEEKKE